MYGGSVATSLSLILFPLQRSSALELAQRHIPSVPIYTDGSKSGEGVGHAAAFPDFDICIFLPVVASIFTAELCTIFLTPSRISFHKVIISLFILTHIVPCRPSVSLYTQSLSSKNSALPL